MKSWLASNIVVWKHSIFFCLIVNRCLVPPPHPSAHSLTHIHVYANTPALVCFSISWTAVTAETSAWQSAVFSVQRQAAGPYCWERSPSRCWCWWVAGKVNPSAAGVMAYQKEETRNSQINKNPVGVSGSVLVTIDAQTEQGKVSNFELNKWICQDSIPFRFC